MNPDGKNFGEAIALLKAGGRVARMGWNGRDMWLQLVPRQFVKLSDETNMLCEPFIGMRTAQNTFVPWLASQTDVLAEDWIIVA